MVTNRWMKIDGRLPVVVPLSERKTVAGVKWRYIALMVAIGILAPLFWRYYKIPFVLHLFRLIGDCSFLSVGSICALISLSGITSALLSWKYNRSALMWGALGVVLPIVCPLFLMFLPKKENVEIHVWGENLLWGSFAVTIVSMFLMILLIDGAGLYFQKGDGSIAYKTTIKSYHHGPITDIHTRRISSGTTRSSETQMVIFSIVIAGWALILTYFMNPLFHILYGVILILIWLPLYWLGSLTEIGLPAAIVEGAIYFGTLLAVLHVFFKSLTDKG